MAVKKRPAPHYMTPLAEEYEAWMRARGRTSHLGRNSVVRRLAKTWDAETRATSPNRHIDCIDEEWMEDYFLTHYGELQPVSKRAYKSALRCFLEYLERYNVQSDVKEFDPGYTSGKSQRPKLWLTMDQMQNIWENEAEPYWRGMFAFLALTCVRTNEMQQMHIADVTDEFIVINRPKVHKFDDRIPVRGMLKPELQRYLFWYAGHIGRPLEPDDYLFPLCYTGQLQTSMRVRNPKAPRGVTFKRIRKMILPNVPEGTPAAQLSAVGCHTLRRSGALALYRKLLAAGYSNAIEIVSALLGHDKISTTQEYLGLNFMQAARNEALLGIDVDEPAAVVLEFPKLAQQN